MPKLHMDHGRLSRARSPLFLLYNHVAALISVVHWPSQSLSNLSARVTIRVHTHQAFRCIISDQYKTKHAQRTKLLV